MSSRNQEILDQLRPVVNVIPCNYIEAILSLHEKLAGANWALGGDLAECLRTVQVEPDGIEIICTKQDSEKIWSAVGEFKPSRIEFKTDKLPWNAVVTGKEYPVYVRSYQFKFILRGINVKVEGDLQYRVGEWDWGDPLEFAPEHVYVVGKETAVMPLSLAAQMYQGLGWADRVQKIEQVTHKPTHSVVSK